MAEREKQKILIVDDERVNRKILTNLLSSIHNVVIAKSGEQALTRLAANPDIDLILLDVMMPEMDGYEVLRMLKNRDESRNIPVIFITALGSAGNEEKGLSLGAVDYITKPFHPAVVKLRVENHLNFVHQKKLLEKLVGRDGLTEIANRRLFDEVLCREWGRSRRTQLPLSLVMVDVDCFKLYNDHYGHARGDKVLKSLANVLNWGVRRSSDFAARYGGEEFVLLFPDTARELAQKRAEEIRGAIEKLAIPHEYSEAIPFVTVSMGGTTAIGTSESPETLINAADEALYAVKKSGRNRVQWAQ